MGLEEEEEGGIPSRSLISFAEFNYGAIKNKVHSVLSVSSSADLLI